MIAALLLALLPSDGIRRDSVEMAEFNVVATHDSVSIAQLILWDGVELSDGFAWRCRDWRAFPAQRSAEGMVTVAWPSIERRGQGGVLRWFDHHDTCWREVHAKSLRWTLTRHDPEIDDRAYLPLGERRKLTGSRAASDRQPPYEAAPH